MSVHRNYWLVVGRMHGDDEDLGMTFEHCTHKQAVADFVDRVWGLEFLADPCCGWGREQAESIGEGVIVTCVYASDSPIGASHDD